jgi:uncharacterized Tic20 family protein
MLREADVPSFQEPASVSEWQNQQPGGQWQNQQPEGQWPHHNAPSSDDRTMGMLCHLLAILVGFLGPLIIWMVKKDDSRFVDEHGREALNFSLTVMIGVLVIGLPTCGVGAIVIGILALIWGIQGTIEAHNGRYYKYPFNFRMVK